MKYTRDILDSLSSNEFALRQFLVKRLGCSDTAADIIQRVAEKLLNKSSSQPIENPKAYLYQSANNELINHVRSEQCRTHYETSFAEQADLLTHSPAREHNHQHNLTTLNKALSELPLLTRQIFLLYTVKGFKQADIASQLDISLSTVEKRLAQATGYCREKLRNQEIYGISVS